MLILSPSTLFVGPGVPISWFHSTKDNTGSYNSYFPCSVVNFTEHFFFVLVNVIESNEELQRTVETTSMPTERYFTIKTTDQLYGKRDVVIPCNIGSFYVGTVPYQYRN